MVKEKTKAKASKSAKAAKPPSTKAAKKGLEEDVLAVMQKLGENGITEVTSRLISDKLGLEPDAGRNKVRTTMKKLEANGKVISEKKTVKEKGARKQYVYKLVKRK